MPTTSKRGAALTVAALGLLLSGALGGCSQSQDDDSGKGGPSAASDPTRSATPSEASSPTTSSSPTATPSSNPSSNPASPSASAGAPEASLLGAADLPPLNASSPWVEKRTTVPGPTSFGACQVFDALSIGAMSVVERSFTGATGDTAGQQVVEFPDAPNTARANKVLEAWHDHCKGQIKGSNVKVGAITSVPVGKGKGWWYAATWDRAGAAHVHSFGVVVNGNRMTLLKMDHGGARHTYAPGQDPMELAVKAASAKM